MIAHCLQASDLCCIRDDRVLFDGLNFTLSAGQVLLLEGKNGSGKTSLLRILCGFRNPDAGEVRWDGEPISTAHYRGDMAYIGHLDGLKKELTVLENLKFALALANASTTGLQTALATVQLSGYDDVLAQALSAGQKRRVLLAKLLTVRHTLWILDEPFTALDKQGVALVQNVMAAHCQNGGLVVLTSHHEVHLPTIDLQRIRLA